MFQQIANGGGLIFIDGKLNIEELETLHAYCAWAGRSHDLLVINPGEPELLVESDTRGYQWKNVFLSDGTQIRMQYQGSYSYAKVEGDELIYQGKPISPGSLAKTIAGGYNRNAWRDLWIKRPEDKEWILADELRAQPKLTAEMLLEELVSSSEKDRKSQS
jgi:hypothetical protein